MYIHGATECALIFITFVYMEEMADNYEKKNRMILDIWIIFVDNEMVFKRFHLANHVHLKVSINSSYDYHDSNPCKNGFYHPL